MIQDAHANEWQDVYEAEAAPTEDGLDIWGLVLRRKWLILLGAVAGATLAMLMYARAAPVFESNAQMLIQEKQNALPVQSDSSAHMQFAARSARIDHSLVLSSPLVVSQAVETKQLDRLPSLAKAGDPVGAIRGGLTVSTAKNSWNVLSLRFRGLDPDDCPQILDALVATYREFLIDSETDVSQEAIELFKSAEDKLTQTLERQLRDYEEFRKTAPLLWKEGEPINVFQERQTQYEQKRSEVAMENTILAARIRAIEDSIARGISLDVLMLVAGQDAQSFGDGPSPVGPLGRSESAASKVGDQLPSLIIELNTMSQQYGRRHPIIRNLKRRIEAVKNYQMDVAQQEAAELLAPTDDADVTRPDFAQIYLAALREQLIAGEEQLRELEKNSKAEQGDAERLGAFLAKDREHLGRIKRTQELFDAVVKRLQEINLIEDATGGDRYAVQELSAARRGRKVEPSLTRFAFSGVALGLLSGFGLAYLLDRADQTFRHPEEVSRMLGVPLMGQIPEMRAADQRVENGSILHPVLITAHRPKSALAESYRAVRTALYFSTRSKQHQVLQVTSPIPGDGKSTLTANLAITFAQSGKRVLLLDADFRRPVVHQRFGLRSDIGLASVVDGKAEPQQAIQQTSVHNLWAMTCGPRPDNPSELLTSPQFEDLLGVLREQYDFVLVDTPPLLAVTDPSVVAARVDGVLLTVRIHNRARSLAMQACKLLRDLDAKLIGVVVNGVGEGQKAYKYGGKYSYGYGYGYGYGNYGDSAPRAAISSYYDEPESDEVRVENGEGRRARV